MAGQFDLCRIAATSAPGEMLRQEDATGWPCMLPLVSLSVLHNYHVRVQITEMQQSIVTCHLAIEPSRTSDYI